MTTKNGNGPPPPTAPPEGYTITGLYAEHVKRLKVVRITPPKVGAVPIAGNNAQGKSSTLDTIMMALGGKDVQATTPINRSAKHARAVVEFGEFAVERTWTDGGSYLTVRRRGEKGKVAAPQQFLDALCGAGLGFDPMAFTRMRPRAQVDALLALLALPEDPRAIDKERKERFTERTAVNKEVKTLELKVAGLAEPPVALVEATEASVADLLAEQTRRLEEKQANDRVRAEAEQLGGLAREAHEKVVRLRRELAAAEVDAATAKEFAAAAQTAVAHLTDPDLAELVQRIQSVEQDNQAIREAHKYRDTRIELEDARHRADDLTDQLKKLDDKKRALLNGVSFPVPGLGFEEIGGEDHVTIDGTPLGDAGASVQLRVGLAMAMAANPTIRVLLLRDASLLDAPTRELVAALAAEHGYQVWMELVGDGDAHSFVIEDGGVIGWPEGTAPTPVPAAAGEGEFQW